MKGFELDINMKHIVIN